MSILQLRKLCQDADKNEIPGKVLIEYETYGVLDKLDERFKNFDWKGYIENYRTISDADSLIQQTSNATKPKLKKENVGKTLSILEQYDEIINGSGKHDELNTDKLQRLFNFLDEEFNMSEIMDTFLNLKHGDVTYLN
eukprot:446921_1